MKIILISVYLILLTCASYANDFSQLNSTYGSTADQLYYSSFLLDYTHNKNDLFWPYKESPLNNLEWGIKVQHRNISSPGIKFHSTEVTYQASFLLGKNQKVSAQVGINNIDQEGFDNETVDIAHLKYEFIFFEKLLGSLTLAQSYDAPVILPLNGKAWDVASKNIQAQLSYKFMQKWQISLQSHFDFLFDRNQRSWLDGQVMYSLSQYPEWIRFGFGSTYLAYQKRSLNYWTPQRFSSYGPRLDISLPICKKFQFFAGGSYNWFQEDAFSPGEGYYARGGLSYGSRNDYLVQAIYENGESTQNDRLWYNQFVSLNIQLFW
jgi:hypothetical protein